MIIYENKKSYRHQNHANLLPVGGCKILEMNLKLNYALEMLYLFKVDYELVLKPHAIKLNLLQTSADSIGTNR